MQRLLDHHPAEWLVYDGLSDCPYIPGEMARLPMRLPTAALSRGEFAARLAEGDRRQGQLLYRPSCPSCVACEAIRVPVCEFRPSKTQRRILRRGNEVIRTVVGPPRLDDERVTLFNRHKIERGLLISDELLDADAYENFLVDSCVDTIEIAYRVDDKLIGVAISDLAADSLSAVYCYFDPAYSKLSPGAFSILKQISACADRKLDWLYLGLWVGRCSALAYKTDYLPHERLIGGTWQRFE